MADATQSTAVSAIPLGYPALAENIGRYASLACFRRFAALNARNILYFQAELLELEEKLGEVEIMDQELWKSGSRNNYAASWYWLGGEGENDPNKYQLRLIMRLRELLHQYSQSPFLIQGCLAHTYT